MDDLKSSQDLLDLQGLDSDIDRLLDRRGGLPELEAYKAAHEELAGLESRIAERSERLRLLDLETDKAEGELQLDEDKAHREEQRLYAGGLSARDAEHLRAEVEMLRRRISDREESVLAWMEERDVLQDEVRNLDSERAAVVAEKGRIEEVVSAAWKEIDAEVARLEEKKASVIPLIDTDLLELYDQIRPAKEGVAVARLGEGVCGACHLALSAAEQAQVAKEAPPRCIHCRRILVLQ
jgi:predicted  nucleic acid-binding Zn-ribbon protein